MQAILAQAPSTFTGDGSTAPAVPDAPIAGVARPAGAGNTFVINLVSSTTPVVLTRPDHAGLKRFTFFVSRRREDGRERFRLHMGYFDTQEEAEKLLDIVRTIYPGAWAGLAPGRRLAAAGGAADNASASGAPSVAAPAAAAAALAAEPSTAAPMSPEAHRANEADGPRSVEVPTLALMPDEGRRQLSDVTLDLEEPVQGRAPAGGASAVAGAGDAAEPRPAKVEHQAARRSLSNVREAIASLADSAIRAPALQDIPELQPAIIPTARPIARQPHSAAIGAPLSDTATLRLLETGGAARSSPAGAAASAPKSQTPQSARAMKSSPPQDARAKPASGEVPREDKPCYAVQLVWSVQPIAMAQIPQLAIFGAYTLYGAEGNRDGRRWYGLRLGFFTDAVSAKQVAHYVRADFATVSVVPVTGRERDQALQAVARGAQSANATPADASRGAQAAGSARSAKSAGAADRRGGAAASAGRTKGPEFAFIEGTDPVKPRGAIDNARTTGAPRVGGIRPSRGAPGKRAKQRPAGQIHGRTRAKSKTLEETLEILGAGELQMADEGAALINDSGVRHLKLEAGKAKSSKLSRLIERLSERIGN